MARLHLFGPPRIELEGKVLTGPAVQRHRLAMLALLALAPDRTVARDKLVAFLWPESSEPAARNRLNVSLHAIRTALEDGVLVSEGDAIRLDADALTVDAVDFERAAESGRYQEAVRFYEGALLDGFHLSSVPFEHWVDRERDRLSRRYRGVLEALAERDEVAGRRAEAVGWWRKRAALDPYDGRIAARLMAAMERAGNRAGALEYARMHARLLEAEFDLRPDPEILRLAEALRADRPASASPGGAIPAPTREASTTPGGADDLFGSEVGDIHVPPPGSGGGRPPHRIRPWAVATVAILLVLGGGAIFFVAGPRGEEGGRSIAVLPFGHDGGDGIDIFAEAVHEEIQARLSSVNTLTVLAPESARRLAGDAAPVPESAARYGVRWVVEGDIRHADGRVLVGVRLIDASRDRQIWGNSYTAELTAASLFTIESVIARRVTDALEIQLTPEEERRIALVPTESDAAYELHLQGRALSRARPMTVEKTDARLDLLRRAVTLDPTFADAWAELADAFLDRAFLAGGRSPSLVDSAIAAAETALTRDPEQAYAWVQLGDARITRGGDPERAYSAYRRALRLQPSNREAANNLVANLREKGQLAEAVRWAEHAHRLEPAAAQFAAGLALMNSSLGRDDEADAWLAHARSEGHAIFGSAFTIALFHRVDLERAAELLEDMAADAPELELRRARAALALYRGDWLEARHHYRSLYPATPVNNGGLLDDELGLAYALAGAGERNEARRIASDVISRVHTEKSSGVDFYRHRTRMAGAHLVLGDTAAALDWLGEAVRMGFRDVRLVRSLPVLDPLRESPRFEALLGRLDELVDAQRRALEDSERSKRTG